MQPDFRLSTMALAILLGLFFTLLPITEGLDVEPLAHRLAGMLGQYGRACCVTAESMQARLRGISTALKPMTAEELGAFFDADREQIGALIREANIRLE